MYRFIPTRAHPELARLADLFERLAELNDIGARAPGNASTAASHLRDLTEPQPRPDRAPDIAARTAEETTAIVEERAVYHDLYDATAAMQEALSDEEYERVCGVLRLAPGAERWWLIAYDINVMVSHELLSYALDALSRFDLNDLNQPVHSTKPSKRLPQTHLEQVGDLLGKWRRWGNSLPSLNELREESAASRFSAVRLIAKCTYTEHEMLADLGVDPSSAAGGVLRALKRAAWSVGLAMGMGARYVNVRRPPSTVAPMMPSEGRGPGPRKSFR